MKSKASDKTTSSDSSVFEQSFNFAAQLNTLKKLDVKADMAKMSLERLIELREYIKHDRTNTDKKLSGGIASFLPMSEYLESAHCKINTAIDVAREMVREYVEEYCSDGEGKIKIANVLTLIEVRICMKQEGSMSDVS